MLRSWRRLPPRLCSFCASGIGKALTLAIVSLAFPLPSALAYGVSVPSRIWSAGPPEELIRRGGRFAALLELEAAGWDWQTDGRSFGP